MYACQLPKSLLKFCFNSHCEIEKSKFDIFIFTVHKRNKYFNEQVSCLYVSQDKEKFQAFSAYFFGI